MIFLFLVDTEGYTFLPHFHGSEKGQNNGDHCRGESAEVIKRSKPLQKYKLVDLLIDT